LQNIDTIHLCTSSHIETISSFSFDLLLSHRWVADTFVFTPDEADELMQLQCAAILYFKVRVFVNPISTCTNNYDVIAIPVFIL
jgi:hypothetical protein